MGAGIAENALAKGFAVAGTDTRPIADQLIRAGLKSAGDLSAMAALLPQPRLIMLYVPAGPPVDGVLNQFVSVLRAGDIVADGGNSYWGDSIRRHARLRERGIHFIDVGTSGGPGGAHNGACFMVGGDDEPVALVESLLRALAVEGGYIHAGGPGAGHFVKLVHNGIEFAMLEAIGEGIELLAHYRERLPVADILKCWRHGSVIRSWLVDLMEATLRAQGGLDKVPAYVEDTGEVNWLVADALRMETPVPVISQAVMQLFSSRDERRNWARAIAMMRHGFGGHPFGADPGIARERHTGRIGGFVGNGQLHGR